MKKLLALLSVGLAVGVMTGCGLSTVGVPSITINSIRALQRPDTALVTGTVEADTLIDTITYAIFTSNNAAVPVNQIWVEGPLPGPSDEKINFNNFPITIHVTSSATAGNYKLKITAIAGPTGEATFDFVVN
jgi:hypothetical protein